MTRQEYTKALQAAAKDIQGENYAGDKYYDQECWDSNHEDGDDPHDAVHMDMSYWD